MSSPILSRSIAFFCLLCSFAISAVFADSPSVAVPAFSSAGRPGGWQFSDASRVKLIDDSAGPYVEVAIPAGSTRLAASADLSVPVDKLRGSITEVDVEIRATDVTKPARRWDGIKPMMRVGAPGQPDEFAQGDANGEAFPVTYDWKPVGFRVQVPANAKYAVFELGLEGSTGTVDFRNVSITILHKMPAAPSSPPTGPVFTGHGPDRLRGVMINPAITPADIDVLRQWGVNLVRWQLTWHGFPHGPADSANAAGYDAWLDGCLAHLDAMLPYFKSAGIMVVLDLHTPPGGRGPDGIDRVFTNADWQQHFFDCWEKMAMKYRGEKQIWAYDLFNEPSVGSVPAGLLDWQGLAEKTARRVREIDPAHAIIVEPDPGGNPTALAYVQPLDVPGVIYSIHMYDPVLYTYQGIRGYPGIGPVYPGMIGGTYWDKNQIRRDLQPAIDYAKKFHVHIYVGEFSAVRWAKGADQYIRDVIDVCESNGLDWTYHAFREWPGWSAEMPDDVNATTPSPTPTDRLEVLLAAWSRNEPQHPIEAKVEK